MAGLTIDDPVTLAQALSSSRIIPGDVIKLRAGTYSGDWIANIGGSAGNPVKIMPYNNEAVTLDGTFSFGKPYLEVYDLEITNSDTTRVSEGSIAMHLPGCWLIGCLIHDLHGSGVYWMGYGAGGVEECVIYNNGFYATDESGHGHAVYTHNMGGARLLARNILGRQIGDYTIHIFSGGANGLEDYTVENNIVYGDSVHSGGGLGLIDYIYRNNIQYQNNCQHGRYSGEYQNKRGSITDNILIGVNAYGVNEDCTYEWEDLTEADNLVYGGEPAERTGYTQMEIPATLTKLVKFSKSARWLGSVAIYNRDSAATVAVDFTSILGDDYGHYLLRNAQNPAETFEFVFEGGTVNVPTNFTAAAEVGGDAPPTTWPKFGACVIEVGSNAPIYYVDATGGDDDNDGLSPATAWQTITKVNAATLNPDETVLFKRGEEYAGKLALTDSGTDGHRIKIGAYGTGARPIINGLLADCALYFNDDYGYIDFEHLDFSGSTGTYSTAYCYDIHHMDFDDCIFRDAAARHGMSLRSNNHVVSHVNINDCLFADNYMSGLLAETIASHDILVTASTADGNGHDTSGDHGFYIGGGVTLDGCTATGNSSAGFKMNDNEAEASYYPVVKNGYSAGNNYGLLYTHKNALAYNNLLVGNLSCNLLFYGNAWGGYGCYFNTLVNSTNATERGMVFTSGVSPNSEIKSNIIIQDLAVVTRGAMHTTIAMATLAANYTIDYNLYYTAGGSASDLRFGYDDTDGAEGRQSWNDWQGAGHDAHSTFLANTPDFVARYTDMHPADGGDLKGKGVAIEGYELDKDGNTRADPPTQGCYEEAAA